MAPLISCAEPLKRLLEEIVHVPTWHARWINTLSCLENCGARKIAACEHPTLVKEEMLKHAAEEFRHAHHLKRQIGKVASEPLENYSAPHVLGGAATWRYLDRLDVLTSRYLRDFGLSSSAIREAAYLLVTYAIELRAGEVYPIYEEILRKTGSRVSVKSILLEEEEHLADMQAGIDRLPSGWRHAERICAIEGELCAKWVDALRLLVHPAVGTSIPGDHCDQRSRSGGNDFSINEK